MNATIIATAGATIIVSHNCLSYMGIYFKIAMNNEIFSKIFKRYNDGKLIFHDRENVHKVFAKYQLVELKEYLHILFHYANPDAVGHINNAINCIVDEMEYTIHESSDANGNATNEHESSDEDKIIEDLVIMNKQMKEKCNDLINTNQQLINSCEKLENELNAIKQFINKT